MNKFNLTGEITEENISAAISFLEQSKGETEVTFYIDSPGGSVFDGLKLLRAMDSFEGKIIAECGVVVASMAAFIALASDEIHITRDTFMLIHSAWSYAEGTAEDLRATADLLEQASNRLGEIVSSKIKNKDDVEAFMSKDTWLGADSIVEAFDNIVLVEEKRFDKELAASYSLLRNRPAALIELEEKEKEPEPVPEPIDNTYALGVLAKAEIIL